MGDEMKKTLEKIAKNTSPAEMKKITEGCVYTAEWIISKVLPDLTQNQIESVALRFVDYVKTN